MLGKYAGVPDCRYMSLVFKCWTITIRTIPLCTFLASWTLPCSSMMLMEKATFTCRPLKFFATKLIKSSLKASLHSGKKDHQMKWFCNQKLAEFRSYGLPRSSTARIETKLVLDINRGILGSTSKELQVEPEDFRRPGLVLELPRKGGLRESDKNRRHWTRQLWDSHSVQKNACFNGD